MQEKRRLGLATVAGARPYDMHGRGTLRRAGMMALLQHPFVPAWCGQGRRGALRRGDVVGRGLAAGANRRASLTGGQRSWRRRCLASRWKTGSVETGRGRAWDGACSRVRTRLGCSQVGVGVGPHAVAFRVVPPQTCGQRPA